ncbi:MAG: DUF2339 domain-containing protein [Bryobacteraceae bacterium]
MDPSEQRQLLERMDAMSAALAGLVRRMQAMENRLASMEGASAVQPPVQYQADAYAPPQEFAPPYVPEQPQAPYQEPVASYVEQPVAYQQPFDPHYVPEAAAAAMPREEQNLESRVGLTWLNRIGVVTLIFGVAFAFKYLVDNEYIGPTGRVILGIAAAFGALFGGDILWNRGQKIFAQGISALGVSILYLSFYATFEFYKLVPVQVAFVLMVLTTVIGTLLAVRYNSVALSTLSQIGGYMTPISLSTGQDAPVTLFSYLTLLNVGAVWLGRRQKWRLPGFFALIASSLIYTAWGADHLRAEKRLYAAVFTGVNYVLFALSGQTFLAGAAQVLAACSVYAIWKSEPATMLYALLGLTAAGGLFAGAERKPGLLAATFSSFWFVILMRAGEGNQQIYVGENFIVLTAAFLAFLGWCYWWIRVAGKAPGPIVLTTLALDGILYFVFAYTLIEVQYKGLAGLLSAMVAATYIGLGWMLWNSAVESREQIRNSALLAAVMALTFLTIAVPVQFSAWRITLAWAMEAAALAWIAKRLAAPRLYWFSTLMLVLVALRIYGVDAWSLNGSEPYLQLVNVRFFIMLTGAAAFWLCAKFFPRNQFAASLYCFGHFILWSALAIEVWDFANRSAGAGRVNDFNLVGQSILLAVYGVVLVAIGVATRTVINRLLGLSALGMVILKLYFVDIWELGRAFQVVAFLGLGVLLVVTSYLYSRYRDKIARIWKDDPSIS